MIDENNFKQVLFEYTMEKYEKRLDEFYDKFFDEFPYDYEGISDELHFKNFIDWLMIEKKLSDTGKTIVEEFVCEHPELKKDMHIIFASLPEKSKEVLKIILNNGGYINYGKLKDFEDEIGFWWTNDPPTSTIGILRVKGLLAVGKMPVAGRMHKIAMIPKDIIEGLQQLYFPED